jgi:hypothetical protein
MPGLDLGHSFLMKKFRAPPAPIHPHLILI